MRHLILLILFSFNTLKGVASFAAPQPSESLPDFILSQCEDIAHGYGAYDPIIRDATNGLIALGAFEEEDFHKVKIGFCGLRTLDGPVATTSCAKDTILLDHKYLSSKEALSLKSTLAHEMKHVFQHRSKKKKFGNTYCASARYVDDTAQLEEEADFFGDQIASYLFVGRPIKIENTCDSPVSFYLETNKQGTTQSGNEKFTNIDANTTIAIDTVATNREIYFYGKSDPIGGKFWSWRSTDNALARFIEDQNIRMRRVKMLAPKPATGPFTLKLLCPSK